MRRPNLPLQSMFFFDPPLFALINADAHTPALSIAAARFISAWIPKVGMALLLLGLWRGSPALRRSLSMLLLSMALAWYIARLIRWGFPMPRPVQLHMGMQWLEHGLRASFPSMHAAGAFALAMAVSLGCTRHNRVLVALAWAAALAMAWSRVHLGVHFPSDVLAGALVGMLSAILIWRAAHALRQRRWLRLGRLRKRLAPGI